MTTIVLNHITFNELPEAWRTQLHASDASQFTIHIEEEPPSTNIAENPLFGIWRDQAASDDRSPTAYELGIEGFGADLTHSGDIAKNSQRLLREHFCAPIVG